MTLFAEADPHRHVFGKVLEKYFRGEKDPATLKILEGQSEENADVQQMNLKKALPAKDYVPSREAPFLM
nr:DUF1810 family protein [Mediterraneibacter glycyrrhizinilyticus]